MSYAKPRTIRGNVSHFDENDAEIGRDAFAMTVWPKGRMMAATLEFDHQKVLRHASWSVGADWTPQEAMTREFVDGELEAHCWFRVDGEETVEAETFSRQLGRVSQRLETGRRVDYLGLHTILADVLVAAARGASDPGVEQQVGCVTNSISAWGMGTYQAIAVVPLVTYVGPDEIDVIAGRMKAEKFRVRWSDHAPEYTDFWVTPGDFLPLKLSSAFAPVRYELTSLEG